MYTNWYLPNLKTISLIILWNLSSFNFNFYKRSSHFHSMIILTIVVLAVKQFMLLNNNYKNYLNEPTNNLMLSRILSYRVWISRRFSNTGMRLQRCLYDRIGDLPPEKVTGRITACVHYHRYFAKALAFCSASNVRVHYVPGTN